MILRSFKLCRARWEKLFTLPDFALMQRAFLPPQDGCHKAGFIVSLAEMPIMDPRGLFNMDTWRPRKEAIIGQSDREIVLGEKNPTRRAGYLAFVSLGPFRPPVDEQTMERQLKLLERLVGGPVDGQTALALKRVRKARLSPFSRGVPPDQYKSIRRQYANHESTFNTIP